MPGATAQVPVNTFNQPISKASGSIVPGQAAPVNTNPTPPIISSKDSAGAFQNNSNNLDQKTPPKTYTTPNGAVVDETGKIITPAPTGTDNPSFNADGTPKTAVEKGAGAGAGTGAEPNVTTGDPILDSLQAWEKTQDAKAATDAQSKKDQVKQMLQTNLAANDQAYAAQIASIQNTYAGLIDTQTRINKLNTDRTKAYGLASGDALAVPLEYTNAVSLKEQEGLSAIQKLDDSRDQLIGQAKAAQATGDAKLLQDSMDAIDKVEGDMRTTLNNIATEVTNRAGVLNTIETQQKTAQVEQQKKLLAAAVAQFGSQYSGITDQVEKDKLVKQIIAQSGGLLDYGTVFSGLETAKTTAAAEATQAQKDKASIAKDKASANASNASAAVDWAKAANGGSAQGPSNTYTKIDNLLTKTDANGNPYTDKNGYITPQGWKQIVDAAAEEKGASSVSKQELLKQYGGKLYPGDTDNNYKGYGLTGADIKLLTGIVTYVPPAGQ